MFLKVQPGDTGREFESEGTVGHSSFSFILRSEERGLPLPWAQNMLYPPRHRPKAVGLSDTDRNLQPWEPTRSFTFCTSYDSIALIKHHGRSNLEKGEITWTYFLHHVCEARQHAGMVAGAADSMYLKLHIGTRKATLNVMSL